MAEEGNYFKFRTTAAEKVDGLIHQRLIASSTHLKFTSEMRSVVNPYRAELVWPAQLKLMGLHKYNAI